MSDIDDTNEVIETSGNGKYRVRLETDQCPSNPRTDRDCNLANVITPKGQGYINVDEDGGPLQDGWDQFFEARESNDEAVKLFIGWARAFHDITVIEQRPHNGAWSLWYVTPEKLEEATATAEEVIETEFGEYRSWAENDVYGVIVEKRIVLVPRDDEDWDDPDLNLDETDTWATVESFWGYVGHEYATSAAKETFEPYAKENAK